MEQAVNIFEQLRNLDDLHEEIRFKVFMYDQGAEIFATGEQIPPAEVYNLRKLSYGSNSPPTSSAACRSSHLQEHASTIR